jgi:hypothetical protein
MTTTNAQLVRHTITGTARRLPATATAPAPVRGAGSRVSTRPADVATWSRLVLSGRRIAAVAVAGCLTTGVVVTALDTLTGRVALLMATVGISVLVIIGRDLIPRSTPRRLPIPRQRAAVVVGRRPVGITASTTPTLARGHRS